MSEEGRERAVNRSGETDAEDAERTVVTPRFDEKSVRRARAAVPLAAGARAWRPGLVALCLAAALVGAVIGGLALWFYQRDARVASGADSRVPEAAGLTSPPAEEAKAQPSAPEDADKDTNKAEDVNVDADKAEGEAPPAGEEAALRGALEEWLAATNARDLGRQMSFYGRSVDAFYLTRNVTREAVRAEKSRVFSGASTIDVRAGQPEIRLAPDGRTATMRFRKKYRIEGGGQDRRGEVLQELRWRRTPEGWKIVSERDLRVIE